MRCTKRFDRVPGCSWVLDPFFAFCYVEGVVIEERTGWATASWVQKAWAFGNSPERGMVVGCH